MSELDDKLSAILGNPQMMQQIMNLAQSMGAGQPEPAPQRPEAPSSTGFDPEMLRSIAGMAQKSGMDHNQQALLAALSPYLSQSRVSKLERAMRAAQVAGMASSFLSTGGLNFLTGR